MTGPGSLDKIAVREIIMAPDFHPGLEALWNEHDRTLDDIRFEKDTFCIKH